MLSVLLTLALAGAPIQAGQSAQGSASPSAASAADVLGTVRITQSVLANGKPLPPGSYQIRLTHEGLPPNPGQSAEAERYVELVANGTVVAREVAIVMTDESPSAIGTSSASSGVGKPRVEMLKGGEFLRVSVRRGNERYLIHFPVAP